MWVLKIIVANFITFFIASYIYNLFVADKITEGKKNNCYVQDYKLFDSINYTYRRISIYAKEIGAQNNLIESLFRIVLTAVVSILSTFFLLIELVVELVMFPVLRKMHCDGVILIETFNK